MLAACITTSKFLRWWSGLVAPSPLNFPIDRAALMASAKSCRGANEEPGMTPLKVDNGAGIVEKGIVGNPLTYVIGVTPGEPIVGTPTPEYTLGQGWYLGRPIAAVMLDNGTKGTALGWHTLGGDAAARRFTEQVIGLLRTYGVGNKGGIGVGPLEVRGLVVLGREVPAPKLNVGVLAVDTRNKGTTGIVVLCKLVAFAGV
ncbi:hypothetical protein R1flu_003912 [Riccia fluitans]|uniref:Uncharacterized protein n=1 Tax=Riccia fluitans TaxID=41844 RepID=A0ABD1YDE4_9MARC